MRRATVEGKIGGERLPIEWEIQFHGNLISRSQARDYPNRIRTSSQGESASLVDECEDNIFFTVISTKRFT